MARLCYGDGRYFMGRLIPSCGLLRLLAWRMALGRMIRLEDPFSEE